MAEQTDKAVSARPRAAGGLMRWALALALFAGVAWLKGPGAAAHRAWLARVTTTLTVSRGPGALWEQALRWWQAIEGPRPVSAATWLPPFGHAQVARPFGWNAGGSRFYRGVGLAGAASGTAVVAPAAGVVTASGPNWVALRVGAVALRLTGLAPRVRAGQTVAAGSPLGRLNGATLTVTASVAGFTLDPLEPGLYGWLQPEPTP